MADAEKQTGTERANGGSFKNWFLVAQADGKPTFLEGQSSSNESFKNSTQTVAPLKTEPPAVVGSDAQYEARIDGKRDLTGSVSFTRLKNYAENVLQNALLAKLKKQHSTRTVMCVGFVEEVDGKILFTGYKTEVLLSGIDTDYPADGEVTGTLNWENAGGTPVDYQAQEWSVVIGA